MEIDLSTGQENPTLVLQAPLSGLVIPLEEVPDPVFAQKMVGEGVAIDPTSQSLHAPFAGEVVQLHPSHHALTLRHSSGLEVLMHIGLDTVGLKGVGFTPRVQVGDQVKPGDTLIDFDADLISQKVPSLISPVILLPSDQTWDFETVLGATQANKAGFLTLHNLVAPPSADKTQPETQGAETISSQLKINLANGLHARPASLLVQASKRFQAKTRLQFGDKQANCQSLVQILELAVPCGGELQLHASGPQSQQAIDELSRLLTELREEPHQPPSNRPTTSASSEDGQRLGGVTAAPGMTAGKIFVLHHQELHPEKEGTGAQAELKALFAALKKVRQQLQELQAQVKRSAGSAQAAIFSAHQDILDDPSLLEAIEVSIQENNSAAWSVQKVITHEVERLEKVPNELIAARANDLKDVGQRIVTSLLGKSPTLPDIPQNSILIAEDLSPSDTAALDKGKVAGFCTVRGGSSSHVAILARSLDIPALAATDARVLNLTNGQAVLLNASAGYLQLDPPAAELAQLENQRQLKLERKTQEEDQAHLPATSQDGHRIKVFANFASVEESEKGVDLGAEGVGLMRSEFLFLNRDQAPTEEEQFQIYSHMTKAMGADRPVIVRTLDVGGDKPLAYCPVPEEENPFLGERGLRLLLKEPKLFRSQLRALLRASQQGPIRIMLPMVTNLSEVQEAKAIIREEQVALGVAPVPVGIMIEVPAAAIMADRLAEEVDFFSIGTNDLTQYLLAMDRNHPSLARQVDGLHPAVLNMIEKTAAAAHARGIELGVCGGIAGDSLGIPLLIGLGVEELSVSLPSVPAVKARVRELELGACQSLAQRALTLSSAADVRALVQEEMPEWGTKKGDHRD